MVGKLIIIFMATIIFIGIGSATTIYVPDDYVKIQWAMDNATDGDRIIVRDGTYTENMDVNKRLTIQSKNGPTHTIISSATGDVAFNVTTDYVNISGFTIKNATGRTIIENHSFVAHSPGHGILLHDIEHCNISNNTVSQNSFGIFLSSSGNNMLVNNKALNNNFGIYLGSSSNNNTLINNTANANNNYGISLFHLSNNTLLNNRALNNKYGIYLGFSSNNNTLMNNVVSSNKLGIFVFYSSNNNAFVNNTVLDNNYGISLQQRSSNNKIYLNNFINNTDDVTFIYPGPYSGGSTNIWNSTSEIPYTYNGKICTSYLGNYWDDYVGRDNEKDGIGDHPHYLIDSNKDNYPLMEPIENYFAPT
ncbi:MAG: right-handed parallel beta-helix repeat-containing protein [Methanosarcinales archaeon]|nr:right-handed parallel beta-helix repeat-containing protein [Methanosarcinales archaeon]